MRLNSYIVLFFFQFIFLTTVFAKTELIIEPEAGRYPILSAISHAKSTVDVVMYGFTDRELITALIKSKRLGKEVRLLLEHQPYRAANENDFAIKRFQQANIEVELPNPLYRLTHQKTLLIDKQLAFVMTLNFTQSAFKKQRNFALLIDEPDMLHEINSVFIADGKHQTVSVTHPSLVWSPDNSREKILALIQNANTDIKIYANDLKDYQIIGALANAGRKGLSVQILTMNQSKKRNKKFEFLRKAGVKIRTDTPLIIHAKVIITDQKKAMVGSINLTTPSINKNRELAVITQDTEVVEKLIKTFNEDWNNQKAHHQSCGYLKSNRARLRARARARLFPYF